MNIRQQKKVQNLYLTRRDLEQETTIYLKEKARVEKMVEENEERIQEQEAISQEDFTDEILQKFIDENKEKVVFDSEYFNKLFLKEVSVLEPLEFLELEEKLDATETSQEFFQILMEHTKFSFDVFKHIPKEREKFLKIVPVLTKDNLTVLENDFTEDDVLQFFPFEFNWFKEPFIISSRLKVGSTRDNIKQAVTYIAYQFDTPISFDPELKEFIYVTNKVFKRKKKGKTQIQNQKKKVYTQNFEERFNQRYLFSSKENKFYDFIENNTKKIVVKENSVHFFVEHDSFQELIIYT